MVVNYHQTPIQYGVKLTFVDGTVVNWYRDSKRHTVQVEKNPLGHSFPRHAQTLEEILAAFDPARSPGPPWKDDQGRPLGAFDGGSRPNPGPGGWGVVLPDGRELCGGELKSTNNRMELTGAIELLKETSGDLRAVGDSSYVINGITRWIFGWRKRNWKTVTGSDVENRDLWEELAKRAQGRDIVWERVAGHSGHLLNERCDELCAAGRRTVGAE